VLAGALLAGLGGAILPNGPARAEEVEASRGVSPRVEWIAADRAPVEVLSLARTPPPEPRAPDLEAVRLVVRGVAVRDAVLTSFGRASKTPLDRLEISLTACAAEPECFESAPLRVVVDRLDREHPLLSSRSIVGAPGGRLLVTLSEDESTTIGVSGAAPLHTARLRFHVLPLDGDARAPGPPALASPDETLAKELVRARALWGACGIELDATPPVVVPPPPPFLISVGCELPAPARGGRIELAIEGKPVVVDLDRGALPSAAARKLANAIEAAGFLPTLVDNPRAQGVALGSTDLIVRKRGGALASVSALKGRPLSTDRALAVCAPTLDLSDGLRHFTDADSLVGTLEERLLIHATTDDDPGTVDVIIVPAFRGESRIGESFIGLDRGVLRNLLILDRTAFRVAHASFTLAHELGHILLDQPGHTDDYGADTPTSLMDSDAVIATAFGPRRLSRDECDRALAQGTGELRPALLTPSR
jgi:hypothetical protein